MEQRGEKSNFDGDGFARRATADVMHDDIGDLAAAAEGDHEAFGRLYDRHAPVVLSLCRQHALSEAEDATQETFIRAFRMLDKLESAQKLRPWLYSIAKRVCSERRRAARRRSHHEDTAMTRATQERPPAVTIAEQVDRSEQLERLGEAMDELTDRERLAIHLHYLEADPIRSASDALGLSRSGYYKLLARARERLGSLMRQTLAT